MYILIHNDHSLSLEEVDDMNRFSIISHSSSGELNALHAISEPAEDNHYWIDANAVIDLSPRKDDQDWLEGFWKMLEKSAPYGYADLQRKRVKAHIE